MIRLSRTGAQISATAEDIARAKAAFEDRHWVRLEGLLGADLADLVEAHLEGATFVERQHPGVGVELCMREDRTTDLLQFATNDPTLFAFIRGVTGCAAIGNFRGRLFRMASEGGHHDDWHADLTDGRLVAMSLNLGRAPFRGGRLHMRTCPSGELLDVVENSRFGDAVVFRLREDLEHRIGEVEGTVPRTTYAGWFRSQPDFRSEIFKGFGRARVPTGSGHG